MNLLNLIRRFRALAGDQTKKSFWSDEDVTDWLNDAEIEACARGRLLLEDANPDVCQIAIEAGRHTYPLHASVYELVRLDFKPDGASCSAPLRLVSREWLDQRYIDWRDQRGYETQFAIQGESSIRLASTPTKAGVLTIEAYRLPLEPMVDEDDEPEIHQASHVHLIDWALHKAFSVPDAEAFDANRSRQAEQAFTAYFGPAPDSDLARITREDRDQTNKVYL